MRQTTDGPTILIAPGLDNSGPDHWQTWLERRVPNALRVEQEDWRRPSVEAWASKIAAAIDAHPNAFIVAHSFACLAAAKAIISSDTPIAGALLVAPADPDRLCCRAETPHLALRTRTLLVASRNDPWMRFEAARDWARVWSAEFVDAGFVGHLNVASGFGPWPQAFRLLERLGGARQSPWAA